MDSAGGRILIVDDDGMLLKVMDAYLTRLGYRVDACHSAADAWARVRADPSIYAIALLDLNLPGMPGEDLARLILGSNPSIRVVVVSGSPARLCATSLSGDARVSFLPKPFAPKELADALK